MQTPHDLRNFRSEDYDDSFQLLPPSSAGWAILTLVALACILEPLFR